MQKAALGAGGGQGIQKSVPGLAEVAIPKATPRIPNDSAKQTYLNTVVCVQGLPLYFHRGECTRRHCFLFSLQRKARRLLTNYFAFNPWTMEIL